MAEEPQDIDLLARVEHGGKAASGALETLYIRYAQRFFSFLRKRGLNKEDAEEVIQKTFVNLMTRNLNTSSIQNARAYLWRCLRYAWQDHLRANSTDPGSFAENPMDEESVLGLLDRLSNEDAPVDDMLGLRDCLGRMWAQFSEEHEERATALYLAVVEGWSREDLAEFLERSYGATRDFLSQCRKRFVEAFSKMCPDYVPGGHAAAGR